MSSTVPPCPLVRKSTSTSGGEPSTRGRARAPSGAAGRRRLARPAASQHNHGVTEHVVPKEELHAVVEARKELGDELEPAVIDAFVERIERRLADRADEGERALKRKRDHQKEMVLGSMAISIPLLAIAAIFTGLPGVAAVCLALAVIAIVTAR